MQVKQVKQDGLLHELEVTVQASEIDIRVDNRLMEVGKTIRIPGFRPGKVPLKILKQKYGRAVMGEILENAVNETTQKALEDKGLQPAMQPKIEVKSFDEGKDLTYTLSVEVLPKFKVANYKGFKLDKPVAKADDKSIDEALSRIASSRRTSKPVESKRASKKGDVVLIDFNGRTAADGVEHPGMAAEGHHLELGGGRFIPGFEDQLIGKKAGDAVEVKVTFPEEYPVPALAGQEAIFDVKIHELHEPVETEINDEFAQSLGMENVDALRKAVEQQINMELEQQSRLIIKKKLLDQLDEAHDFEIPAGMKAQELENITRQVMADYEQRGGEAELNDEEKEELEAIAGRRVRLGLVLAEIGKDNDIRVSDQELQKAVIAEAQKYPGEEKRVFDYFARNRHAIESLRAPIYEDKVIDFILELSDIATRDVTPEQLVEEEQQTLNEGLEDKDKKPAKAKKAKSAAKKPESANKEKSGDKKKKPAKDKEESGSSKKKASE
ncbi:MAG: trigger factor [Alphaproteobacteria bacterium]|nr:trigger factor [Alphaproteobacteria bacterium]MCB9974762.1 trigger factor [Rhodospirillales bacterium]